MIDLGELIPMKTINIRITRGIVPFPLLSHTYDLLNNDIVSNMYRVIIGGLKDD